MSTAEKRWVPIEEYLAIEKQTGERHQWLDGELFLMAGGLPRHNAISQNIGAALRELLRDEPCQVFNSDQKVRCVKTGLSTYADVTVVCDALEMDSEVTNAINNPAILVEVLSESTSDDDRGGKFANYRTIDSLRQYISVHQDKRAVEFFVRTDDGWTLRDVEDGGVAVGNKLLSLDEIYLKVKLDSPEG